jgi:DNA-binding response OmpR family regulator
MLQDLKQPVVFVVDDEQVIATTLALILRQKGFEAHSFDLPEEALAAAREMAPDLLLTDIVMPVLNGIELALRMLEERPSCKVLMISGQQVTTELLAKASANGNDFEVLAKPVHPKELLGRIDMLFA